MGIFDAPKAELLEGQTVPFSYLVEFDLETAPLYLWMGFGTFEVNGKEYIGTGSLLSISELTQPTGGTAPATTFELSGVDQDLLQVFRDTFATEAKGRNVTVSLQFILKGTLLPAYDPVVIWSGTLAQPEFGLNEDFSRVITANAESIFAERSQSVILTYSDSSWQDRYAGDLAMQFTPRLKNLVLVWPTF